MTKIKKTKQGSKRYYHNRSDYIAYFYKIAKFMKNVATRSLNLT